MRSEQLENIIALLRSSDSNGPSTVDDWRVAYDNLGRLVPANPDIAVEPADGVRGEWIGDGDGSIVVYLHGGGYCIGSLTSHRAMLTHLAAATEGRVLAVDYRLAPEHPFPAALDDAIAAYRFVAAGHDPSSIVLAGDSAGGGLTVATLMALRDAGDRLPAGGICLSPWADLSQSGATIHSNATIDPMVRADDLDRWADAYAGTTDPRRPELSPLFGDLTGLPPLHIEVGTAEVLLDDSRRLAARVRASGGEVTYFEGEDLVHVWHFFAGLVPEADEATRRVAAFVRARTAS
ncbi:MAG: alpha/beta hydrolase [Acidobacteriota bacterium]|jgi:acetyl esterase/lipase